MGKSVVLLIITLGIVLAFVTYSGRQTISQADPKTGVVATKVNRVSVTAIIQSITTAEATYNSRYQAFAANLASLGPGSATDCHNPDPPASAEHACIISDPELAGDTCSGDNGCTKDGYSFRIGCGSTPCNEYVVLAVPTTANAGATAYCSTSDSVIHSSTIDPTAPPNVSPDECRAWPRI
jgi:hypothetical protein